MRNPYRSPIGVRGSDAAAEGRLSAARNPLSLCVLVVLFNLTLVMALINLHQEAAGSEAGSKLRLIVANCMIAGFSALSQVPGLFIAGFRWKGSSNSVLPMLYAAYVIALTGVAAFFGFVLQSEPSDSMNSASHMHIFFFPVIHLGFAIVLYFIASLVSIGLASYSRYASRRNAGIGNGQGLTSVGSFVSEDG